MSTEDREGRLDLARRRSLCAGVMSTLVEIEAAIDTLPLEQQRELAVRLEERTRPGAATRPEVKIMDRDTFEEALEFVLKRHAPLLRKLAE